MQNFSVSTHDYNCLKKLLIVTYGWGKITTSVVGREIIITKRDKKTRTTENFEDGKTYKLSYEAPCIKFTVSEVAAKFLDSHLLTQLTNCARSNEESERLSTVLGIYSLATSHV